MAEEIHQMDATVRPSEGRPKLPPSPGASTSPQRPGQTPDRSDLPGFNVKRVPRIAGPVRRPLTQYGTAEELIPVFPSPNAEATAGQFEQGPASHEEMRKAYPWKLPPIGPTPVFRLDQGVRSEPPALPGWTYEALPDEVKPEEAEGDHVASS